MNIEIIKVPEGTTEKCQPLDCRVYGSVKSRVKRIINEKKAIHLSQFLRGGHIQGFQKLVLTKPQVKDLLLQSGSVITTSSCIQETWNKAIYE